MWALATLGSVFGPQFHQKEVFLFSLMTKAPTPLSESGREIVKLPLRAGEGGGTGLGGFDSESKDFVTLL